MVNSHRIRGRCQTREAGARGAAILAFVGLGRLTFEAAASRIRVENTYTPRAEHRANYDRLYAEFLKVYSNNKGAYGRLNRH